MSFITTNPAAIANLINKAAAEAVRVEWDMDFSAAELWSHALRTLTNMADDEAVAIPHEANGDISQNVLDALDNAINKAQSAAGMGWAV